MQKQIPTELFDEEPSSFVRILMGCRNGFFYGCRVRFMHSLVMSLLFKPGSIHTRFKDIIIPTIQHGNGLALYSLIYKTLFILLKKLHKGKKRTQSILLAGAVAGRVSFGKKTSVHQQIILYLLSRNITSIGSCLQKQGIFPKINFFPILASISLGLVMYLYEKDKNTLQVSLTSSMDFLYKESDERLSHWSQLVPFYIPIKILTCLNNHFKTPLPLRAATARILSH